MPMQFKSKALEANLANFKVEVAVDPRYQPLQENMARYHGLQENPPAFMPGISHPYKNWKLILQEARGGYALGYFHLLKTHPRGAAAARLYIDLFPEAFETGRSEDMRIDGADHLLQFLQQMIKKGSAAAELFDPLLTVVWQRISDYGSDNP